MEMGAKKEVAKIERQDELYQCPSCGYTDGFHVSFRWNRKRDQAEVCLICPGCHSRFQMGWKITT